ncbi:MAG TPA: PAS domain S-box protein [Piscinibacter sp.]|nr:PAS domain S-box protein [Piscinibacter sp.]HNW62775.1 PAS domain S-box protein [Piscinibacter sp.]HOY34487.1 PAS domain S-box protein [Piscinibacter sp.]HPG77927.1 PAS domain S-box protein [Piscinibacter sp.]HPM65416.1 PAS domain S-box protein [Piscinibacter sp.]
MLAVPTTDLPLDAMFHRLFEASPDPTVVAEFGSGRMLMLNPQFERLIGCAPGELDGLTVPESGIWTDETERHAYLTLLETRGRLKDYAATLNVRGRGPVPVSINASLFEHEGRRCILGTVRDVSGTQHRDLQYEAILENASVGIAFTRDRQFQHVNPRFEEIFGWPAGTLIGQSGRAVWPSDAAYAEIGGLAGPLLQSGAAFEGEFEMTRRDGRVFWASVRARAIDPRRPGSVGTIWIIDDITESRRSADALAEARDQAESASRAKSEFLANTSHEIRTPLNGLLGLVRLAQDPALAPGKLREYLEHIDDSAQALAGLISDILDLSKIEAGRLTLEQVDFDLHQLLGSVRDAYTELAAAKGLGFRFELGAGVPRWVNGDPMRLRQIVANYLSNALKFTERGAIEVRALRRADGGTRIEVSDNGPGIAPALQTRLFHPFSQADASTTRRYGGTGLGLSICRQLAVLMGGGVGMLSTPGEGSRFWADLPLRASSAPPVAQATRFAPVDALAGARILLVEDHPVNTLVAEATLAHWGAQVVTTGNGALAVEAVAAATAAGEPFDAVLMDLQMPVLGGIDATIAIRRTHGAMLLPVIALTADVLVSERENAMRQGMNDFLSKPIDPERLVRVLAHWVRRARQARG